MNKFKIDARKKSTTISQQSPEMMFATFATDNRCHLAVEESMSFYSVSLKKNIIL